MKRIAVCLVVLVAAARPVAAGGESGGKKAEVVSRIEALLEKGELDSAKEMLDYFLAKNPADKDLLRLLDAWRVKKGDVAGLFVEGIEKPENRAKLREAALRAVKATLRGNPEEWEALTTALPETEWRGHPRATRGKRDAGGPAGREGTPRAEATGSPARTDRRRTPRRREEGPRRMRRLASARRKPGRSPELKPVA